MRGARAAAALLPHVNLLLAMIAGAGIATAARLKWDPSIYIVVRELLPAQYRALAAALLAAPLALLALGHLASVAAALPPSTARRVLFLVYAACMVCMVACEVAAAAWGGARAAQWLQSRGARQAAQLAATLAAARDDLRALLHVLARWHPLPEKMHALIDEASADLPQNAYFAAALALLCALLQLLGAVLASLIALAPLCSSRTRRQSVTTDTDSQKSLLFSSKSSARSLKTIYKNGRLQIV